MGAYYSLTAYKKNNIEYSHIECYGLYEVDLNAIDNNTIFYEDRVYFYYGIQCLELIKSSKHINEWGFFSSGLEFLFYEMAINYFSGDGFIEDKNKKIGIMFSPLQILKVIEKLLAVIDDVHYEYSDKFDSERLEEERLLLKNTKKLLEQSIEADAIICCEWS